MGEEALRSIAQEHDRTFTHELHSLRVVDFLESPYKEHHGLNLTFAVRDGIVCHYGERFEREICPDRDKAADSLPNTKRGESRPATLEGCVVRWADKVAYLGRDLEDAITIGLLERSELPPAVQSRLGIKNKEIIGSLVRELCRTSAESEDDRISVREEVHDALNQFYEFNLKRIYMASEARKHGEQVHKATQYLFEYLLGQLEGAKRDGDLKRIKHGKGEILHIFAEFLEEDIRNWNDQPEARVVVDFIAGMTDSFFNQAFVEFFLPRSTV
jgi:dGTPase